MHYIYLRTDCICMKHETCNPPPDTTSTSWIWSLWTRCAFSVLQYVKQTNSVALVRKWTIPTEWPPLVGEGSANLRIVGVAWSVQYSRFSRQEPLLFLPSSSSVVLTRLNGPHSRPTTSQKIWYGIELGSSVPVARNSDHRGGHCSMS
jgi:hypothetical protein